MYDQVNGLDTSADTQDAGFRIDPMLARSWLLVNGAQYDRFAPAARSRADIVVLDIEDAVAPQGKVAARENVVRWLAGGHSDWVRVNGFGTQFWADDLDMLSDTSVGWVMLAMVIPAAPVPKLTVNRAGSPRRADSRRATAVFRSSSFDDRIEKDRSRSPRSFSLNTRTSGMTFTAVKISASIWLCGRVRPLA